MYSLDIVGRTRRRLVLHNSFIYLGIINTLARRARGDVLCIYFAAIESTVSNPESLTKGQRYASWMIK